jgi:hypothetical protein
MLGIALNDSKAGIFCGHLTFPVLGPYLFGNFVSCPQIEVGKNELEAVLNGKNIRGGREIQTQDAKRGP